MKDLWLEHTAHTVHDILSGNAKYLYSYTLLFVNLAKRGVDYPAFSAAQLVRHDIRELKNENQYKWQNKVRAASPAVGCVSALIGATEVKHYIVMRFLLTFTSSDCLAVWLSTLMIVEC